MAKKLSQIPDDPPDFIRFIIREVFNGSPQAFARAAKVSRAGVNKWLAKPPPTLNAYVKTAIENELAEITTRYDKIADIEVAVRARDELMQLAAIRVLKRLQMQEKKS